MHLFPGLQRHVDRLEGAQDSHQPSLRESLLVGDGEEQEGGAAAGLDGTGDALVGGVGVAVGEERLIGGIVTVCLSIKPCHYSNAAKMIMHRKAVA